MIKIAVKKVPLAMQWSRANKIPTGVYLYLNHRCNKVAHCPLSKHKTSGLGILSQRPSLYGSETKN
jgi:hypothetical protein